MIRFLKLTSCRSTVLTVRLYCSTSSTSSPNSNRTRFKWFGIPVSLGVACLGLVQFKRILQQERSNPSSPQPMTWQLTGFLIIPSRQLSRAWGSLMSLHLPVLLRKPLLGLYSVAFGCNLKESERESLSEYESFSDLFTRRLKVNARHMDQTHQLVCPCDGKVLHYGTITDSYIEQVKGVHYSLSAFFGPELFQPISSTANNKLYHVVIYLGPGDCHHFYSPTKWSPKTNRHLPGELLTVAPWAARTMPGLFALNERVILSGEWDHGYFSYSTIGAYNVGSIHMSLNEELKTNVRGHYKYGTYTDKELAKGCQVQRGEHLGYFDMGSSIVLIFEGPSDLEFVVSPGQGIKIGQPLAK